MSELKRCPFCEGSMLAEEDEYTYCLNCGVMVETVAWNSRPLEDAAYRKGLERAIEIAEGMIGELETLHIAADLIRKELDNSK